MQNNTSGIRIKVKWYVRRIFTTRILRSLIFVWIVNRLIYRACEKLLYGWTYITAHSNVHISQYTSGVFLTTCMLSELPVVVLHHHTVTVQLGLTLLHDHLGCNDFTVATYTPVTTILFRVMTCYPRNTYLSRFRGNYRFHYQGRNLSTTPTVKT